VTLTGFESLKANVTLGEGSGRFVGGCTTLLGWLALCAGTVKLTGTCASIFRANRRGFDFTDEAFTILLIRDGARAKSGQAGFNFFWRAILRLSGGKLWALRDIKLVLTVGTSLLFAWAFTRWLRATVERVPGWRTPWPWLLGLACGGASLAVYTWVPLSPSYNDTPILLLTVALGFLLLVFERRRLGPNRWHALASGAVASVITLLVFVRFPVAALVSIPYGVTILSEIRAGGLRALRAPMAGAVASLVFLQLVTGNILRYLSDYQALSVSLRNRGYRPIEFFRRYLAELRGTLNDIQHQTRQYILVLLICTVLALLIRKNSVGKFLPLLPGLIMPLVLYRLLAHSPSLRHGGVDGVGGLSNTVPILLTLSLALAAAGALLRAKLALKAVSEPQYRRIGEGVGVFVCLLAGPIAAQVGTSNRLLIGATTGSGLWTVLIAFLAFSFASGPASPHLRIGATLGLGVLSAVAFFLTMDIAFDGAVRERYREPQPTRTQTVELSQPPILRGIRLDPARAEYVNRLRELVEKASPVRPLLVIAPYDMPGEVLAIGAQTLGEPWWFSGSPGRVADALSRSCRTGRKYPQPVILTRGPWIGDELLESMRRCGIEFPGTYRRVGVIDRAGPSALGNYLGLVTVWGPASLVPLSVSHEAPGAA
jgi:hypothetical protein